jgi:hypothetical protein
MRTQIRAPTFSAAAPVWPRAITCAGDWVPSACQRRNAITRSKALMAPAMRILLISQRLQHLGTVRIGHRVIGGGSVAFQPAHVRRVWKPRLQRVAAAVRLS